MSENLKPDGIGGQGISLNAFAARSGISVEYMTKLCRDGKVFGARKHPLTKKWWIYPPAKLLCNLSTRKTRAMSALKPSGLADCVQV